MNRNRINLLPEERKRLLSRGYYIRVGTVACICIIFLIIVAGVTLAPSYIYLNVSHRAKEAYLANLDSRSATSNESSFVNRLELLTSNANLLLPLKTARSASGIVREILSVPRAGITLSGVGYLLGTGTKPSTVTLTGSASTRDALRTYQLELQNISFIKNADVPVSTYAKDTEIAFTVAITLTP